MKNIGQINPNYLAYCKAHGKTPEEMIASDEKEYPGGKMCGFIIWISQQERRYKTKHPENFIGDFIHNRDLWTTFLTNEGTKLI